MTTSAQLEIVLQGNSFQLARIGSLVVTTFADGGATIENIEQIDRLQEAHRRAFPRFSTLSVVSGVTMRSPPNEVRVKSAALDTKYAENLLGTAIVIEARGLPAVIARTFLAAYSLISPRLVPLKSFNSRQGAFEWLQSLPTQVDDIRLHRSLAAELAKLIAEPAPRV